MPRPIIRLLTEQIEKEGGPDVILDRIRAGEIVKDIAKDYNVSRGALYLWRKANNLEEEWAQAMEDSGDAAVDRAHELAEDDSIGLREDYKARLDRANFFLKLAKIRNQKKYGKKGDTININAGDLHLQALQAAGHVTREEPNRALPEEDDIQDAEIVSEDDADLARTALPAPEPADAEEEPDEDWDEALDDLL